MKHWTCVHYNIIMDFFFGFVPNRIASVLTLLFWIVSNGVLKQFNHTLSVCTFFFAQKKLLSDNTLRGGKRSKSKQINKLYRELQHRLISIRSAGFVLLSHTFHSIRLIGNGFFSWPAKKIVKFKLNRERTDTQIKRRKTTTINKKRHTSWHRIIFYWHRTKQLHSYSYYFVQNRIVACRSRSFFSSIVLVPFIQQKKINFRLLSSCKE